MSKVSIETIKTVLKPIFVRYGIKDAILFGSFAKGSATERSDVDLLVESNLRGLRFVGFSEAVREAVGRPVDIFDVSHIEKGSRIDREIRETGVTIYQRH
ncbi:MAG: nucleotidyltransferase domain-containing protein [Clostridia bacterium]|nr:nucleotidyltransferase domain-containing protein [Clostridia bacterium]MBQ8640673.1 nucleotidyltransferase domain-containing protein [Clostridia bacterium]